METIRDHATTIENALDSYRREGTEGDRLRFYNGSGEIAKVLVYPGSSADGVYEEYFTGASRCFIPMYGTVMRISISYYQDGLLIRWIDADGKVHDKESDNDKYVELGDKYWSNSVQWSFSSNVEGFLRKEKEWPIRLIMRIHATPGR